MKLYTFTIPTDVEAGRLYPLVQRMLPQLPEYALREAFQNRDVKMDGKRVARDEKAMPGAEIKVYTRYEERQSIPVLYADENVLVVRKPAGVSCEADQKGGLTIAALAQEALRQTEPDASLPLLCHRLDNQTEGLLLLARTQEAQTAMQEAFRHRMIHKKYTCVVKGTPRPASAVLHAYLRKDAAKARVQVLNYQAPNAAPIITEYRVLEPGECARLEITLHTGRTHQIRAQMAAIGHPLLGDDQYGDRAFNKEHKVRRLMLCATELSFSLEGKWRYLNEQTLLTKPSF
ncbi:MAG: RluA family pseudouridine synthase [Clostridiales bacterium]|nr:RluA family pseudouridine synthase [Clostridiales bacterium]